MKHKARFWVMALLVLLFSPGGYAQRTKESLEKEIKALQKEIETANKLLKETSKNKETTMGQVSLMDKKIKDRQKLINACNEQIKVLDKNINKNEKNIQSLNGELKKLNEEYSKMVLFAYRNKSHYDQLEFLFASEDFNQATKRMRYIQQFADARKTKMDQIANTRTKVSKELEEQRKNKEQQEMLLAEQKAQKEALSKEKEELNTQVNKLKKQEGSIKQSIQDKQAQAKKFQKQIDDIIAAEIKKTKERTATEIVLSTSFTANQGKLPWPVENGVVSSSFGKHASSISEKVIVTNNGVDIATSENAKARCVFDGVVVTVVKPSASNIGVIVRHGDYFTVYSQLDEVYVNRGDKVKTKQNIGKVHTDRSEGKTEIHFELRHGTETLNPSLWLAK